MRLGQDIAVRFPGMYLVHHNIPGMKVAWHEWADQHLLFIPLQGEITILLRSGSLVGGPGKMVYLPPKTSLNFQASKTLGERLVCLVDDSRWRALTSFQSGPAMSPAQQLCKEQLFYLLLNPTTKSSEAVVSAFIQVLAESLEATQQASLLEVTHLEAKVRDERVRKALTILLRDHRTRVRMEAVVTIPSNTLIFRKEGLQVGLVRNGKAELVPVKISRDYGNSVEIVSGLQPTDAVIVDPADSLVGGMPVRINGEPAGGTSR